MISTRSQSLQASPLRKLSGSAAARKASGVHVYHLNIGQPDLKTSDVFFDALRTVAENPVAYAESRGRSDMLRAWIRYYRTLGVPLDETQIVITTGGSEALHFAFTIVADPGDEMIVFEPFYTNYNAFTTIAGVQLVPVMTDIQTGFRLPSDQEIERAITPRTRAILVCNPSNPTGTVLRLEEMQRLAALVKKHNIFLIADEVYREFVFDSAPQTFLTNSDLAERLIVVDSASKRFNLCGARIGTFVSHNAEVMQAALKMAMARLASPTIEQLALIPVIDDFATTLPQVVAAYRKRLDITYDALKAIPGVTAHKPEGAFYIICGLPVDSAEEFCQWTIEEFSDQNETVLVSPAAGFYATPGKGKNEIRLACVLEEQQLMRALELLHLALTQYPYGKSI